LAQAIATRVKSLRRKLDSDREVIETVPGIGERFERLANAADNCDGCTKLSR